MFSFRSFFHAASPDDSSFSSPLSRSSASVERATLPSEAIPNSVLISSFYLLAEFVLPGLGFTYNPSLGLCLVDSAIPSTYLFTLTATSFSISSLMGSEPPGRDRLLRRKSSAKVPHERMQRRAHLFVMIGIAQS